MSIELIFVISCSVSCSKLIEKKASSTEYPLELQRYVDCHSYHYFWIAALHVKALSISKENVLKASWAVNFKPHKSPSIAPTPRKGCRIHEKILGQFQSLTENNWWNKHVQLRPRNRKESKLRIFCKFDLLWKSHFSAEKSNLTTEESCSG